jgi:hypothetical protein
MDGDWQAVGQAISHRLSERGMTMTELATQADVSLTTVRELVHVLNTRQRRTKTLAAISTALGFREDHLHRVLRGQSVGPPHDEPNQPCASSLSEQVRLLSERVTALEDWRHDVEHRAGGTGG